MEAAAASYCRPLYLPPHFSSSIKCAIRLQKILPESSVAGDGAFAFASRRQLPRSSKGISSSSRSMNKKHETKATNSSQEEITTLFRRIRIAISKTESIGNTDNTSSDKERSADESVSVKAMNEGKGKRQRKQGVIERQASRNSFQRKASGSKLSRSPSNFDRRSQIPSPSATSGMDYELKDGKSIVMNDEQLNGKVDQMKLAQLKQLAKSRGMKGYTKLKKQELVELLKYGSS